MNIYPKIQTVYFRDPATNHKTLLEGQFARPEFEYLQNAQWVFTEKVDGTNVRVDWDMYNVYSEGKTAKAQIPPFLVKKLWELFPIEKFKKLYPDISMCLYGEGYGARIQKGGGNYIPDGVDFILFDVLINGNWLERENVEDIADKLGIRAVPIVGKGSLKEGIFLVKTSFTSHLVADPLKNRPEGLVMRPAVELNDRRGKRIITKLKLKDFGL